MLRCNTETETKNLWQENKIRIQLRDLIKSQLV